MSAGQDRAAAERSAHVQRGGHEPEPEDNRPWHTVLIRDTAGEVVRRFQFRAEEAAGWRAEIIPGFEGWVSPRLSNR